MSAALWATFQASSPALSRHLGSNCRLPNLRMYYEWEMESNMVNNAAGNCLLSLYYDRFSCYQASTTTDIVQSIL